MEFKRKNRIFLVIIPEFSVFLLDALLSRGVIEAGETAAATSVSGGNGEREAGVGSGFGFALRPRTSLWFWPARCCCLRCRGGDGVWFGFDGSAGRGDQPLSPDPEYQDEIRRLDRTDPGWGG